eukprot:CAMPEP_0170735326 /NCGR_PEP_ID=MMETSP0437-20130122/3040_1 /TAXON_ID=0 /ORGANISM="Sexangularia sp." /LENGTH=591 /DNA_ID=CAMNT_0011073651 /DNA_START=196 /DNA_END=1967 /DNA_ORIENTATION=+
MNVSSAFNCLDGDVCGDHGTCIEQVGANVSLVGQPCTCEFGFAGDACSILYDAAMPKEFLVYRIVFIVVNVPFLLLNLAGLVALVRKQMLKAELASTVKSRTVGKTSLATKCMALLVATSTLRIAHLAILFDFSPVVERLLTNPALIAIDMAYVTTILFWLSLQRETSRTKRLTKVLLIGTPVAHLLMIPAMAASAFVPSMVLVFYGIFGFWLIVVVIIFEWGSRLLVKEMGSVLRDAVERQRKREAARQAGALGDQSSVGDTSAFGSVNQQSIDKTPPRATTLELGGDGSASDGSRDDAAGNRSTAAPAARTRKERRQARRERTAAEEAHARLWRFTRLGHLTTAAVACTLVSFGLVAAAFPATEPDSFLIGQSLFRVLELMFVALIMRNLHPTVSGAMSVSYMLDLIFRPGRIRKDVRVAQRKAKLRAAAGGRGASAEHNLRDGTAVPYGEGPGSVRYKNEAQSYVESFVLDVDSAIMDKGMGDFVDPIFVGGVEPGPEAEPSSAPGPQPPAADKPHPSAVSSPAIVMSTGGTLSAEGSSESSGKRRKLSRGSSRTRLSRGSSHKSMSKGSSRKRRPAKPTDPGDPKSG